jgi:polyhydroxyalkanoate synthesis regulator phasin
MIDQEKIMNNMMEIARVSMETGLENINILQRQAEKSIDLAINNTNILQEESRKGITNMMEGIKKSQEICREVVNDGVTNLSDLSGSVTPKKKVK